MTNRTENPRSPIEVVGGILWRGSHFLAAQRPEGRGHAGFWEFPGGKVEQGETREQALTRELAEELSITVRTIRFWRTVEHTYPQKSVRLHFFHVLDFSGTPSSNEGQTLRWVTPEEAQKLPFLEADRPLLPDLTPPDAESPASAGQSN